MPTFDFEKITPAFTTGSRTYGTPRADSDIDLVILIENKDAELISQFSDTNSSGYTGQRFNLRFGPLNLICFCDITEYLAWKEATKNLEKRKPVTKEKAIAHIEAIKNLYRLMEENALEKANT